MGTFRRRGSSLNSVTLAWPPLFSHPISQQLNIAPPLPGTTSWPTIFNRIQRRKVYKRYQTAPSIIRKSQEYNTNSHYNKREHNLIIIKVKIKVKVKQSHYRPGQALSVAGE